MKIERLKAFPFYLLLIDGGELLSWNELKFSGAATLE